MTGQPIRFDDGAAYERMMGGWSKLVGERFLDWLGPGAGLSWVDIGCGNGVFTEQIVQRYAPSEIEGIDPSEGQIKYAVGRPGARGAVFRVGDAMALPYSRERFDLATMALVLFFVPEPAKGVAEMVRVVKPGGTVAAYAWDMFGGGFPLEPVQSVLRAMGKNPVLPPSPEASREEVMRALWIDAGLQDVETRAFTVERSFPSFDDFWETSLNGASFKAMQAKMTPEELADLKAKVRANLPDGADGKIAYTSRANAVKGRLPG